MRGLDGASLARGASVYIIRVQIKLEKQESFLLHFIYLPSKCYSSQKATALSSCFVAPPLPFPILAEILVQFAVAAVFGSC